MILNMTFTVTHLVKKIVMMKIATIPNPSLNGRNQLLLSFHQIQVKLDFGTEYRIFVSVILFIQVVTDDINDDHDTIINCADHDDDAQTKPNTML